MRWGWVFVILLVTGLGGVLVARTGTGASPSPPVAGGTSALATPEGRVRVEVLNAAGTTGLARSATDRLRDVGLDVVDFGNARPFDRDTTVVLDRVGWPEAAQAVADALGIGIVRTELDPNLYVDVSVLLGKDWDPRSVVTDTSADRSWWDPRGWFGR